MVLGDWSGLMYNLIKNVGTNGCTYLEFSSIRLVLADVYDNFLMILNEFLS